MWGYLRALGAGFRRPVFVFLFFFALSTCLAMSGAFYFFEEGVNEKIVTGFDAIYFIVTTMTAVGYGDVFPQTTMGRLVAMLTMIIGTGIYATFTAVLATILIELEMTKS